MWFLLTTQTVNNHFGVDFLRKQTFIFAKFKQLNNSRLHERGELTVNNDQKTRHVFLKKTPFVKKIKAFVLNQLGYKS